MNRILHLVSLLFISINLYAQAPQKMTYQAVIRNASNNLVVSSPVKMKISILQGSTTGPAVYSEQHNPTTNANGLVSVEIGEGTNKIGTFSAIDWGNGTYFLKTETDPTNGNNLSIVGTSQLLSVPYALHSNCVSSSLDGDTLLVGCKKYVIPGIAITGTSDHSCGATNIHNATLSYGSMTDQEGNRYKTIKIGNQTWMAENLKTTKYRNGVNILSITDNTQWINNTTGAYCSINNNTSNDCPYGKLYNWYAVINNNNICPAGWHVPSDGEWNVLVANLDPTYNPIAEGTQSTTAGGKMKSVGTQYWQSPNTNATNNSGYSGFSTGSRSSSDGVFNGFGIGVYWWSSTQFDNTYSWSRGLRNNNGGIERVYWGKGGGFPVRCLKD